ncbi:MAG: channel-forming protein ArfA/OmpATb [Mycobacterium sp.]
MSSAGTTRFYRRPPGAGWLAALIVIPLLLGVIGSGGMDRTDEALPPPVISTPATLTPASGARPAVVVAPLSLQRSGDDVVLSGQVPDELSRAFALDRTRTVLAGSNVIDLLTVIGGITAVDLAGLNEVLTTGAALPDFGFSIDGGDIVLTGTAQAEAAANDVADAVQTAWPELTVVDDISVITPGLAPSIAPPGPGPTGDCADLQAKISGLLRTPIQYDANGSGLADSSAGLIAQIVSELRDCPAAKVSITVHTDDFGTAAGDLQLSTSQAQTVADAFIRQGVGADRITAQGVGSAEPASGSDTESGRAQNHRVEITVS